MNIGRMNKRVVLKYIDKVADGLGGNTATDVIVDEIWAELQTLSANERLIYGLEAGVRAIKMRTRFNIDRNLTQQYVIEYTDMFNDVRRFRITSVIQPNEDGRFYELILNERTD